MSNQSDASKGDSQNKGTAPTVNNKPSVTLMGLSDPIIKRESDEKKQTKKQRYPSIVWSPECLLRELWREKD